MLQRTHKTSSLQFALYHVSKLILGICYTAVKNSSLLFWATSQIVWLCIPWITHLWQRLLNFSVTLSWFQQSCMIGQLPLSVRIGGRFIGPINGPYISVVQKPHHPCLTFFFLWLVEFRGIIDCIGLWIRSCGIPQLSSYKSFKRFIEKAVCTKDITGSLLH